MVMVQQIELYVGHCLTTLWCGGGREGGGREGGREGGRMRRKDRGRECERVHPAPV